MSNDRSIATVSGVLQARIRSVLSDNGMGGFGSEVSAPSEGADAGVYLHLFRVVPDVTLQSLDYPTRRADGSVVQRPQLALNLHYQLSFVTSEDNGAFEAERMAGLVLSELHARPILSSAEIEAFVSGLPLGDPLRDGNLHEQDHGVRVSMLAMDLEDHSRLWSMLNQSFHALTVGLEVASVLLDDVVTPVVPLPVVRPAITVVPSAPPVVEVAVSSAREQPIVQLWPGGSPQTESLVLRGHDLVGARTFVWVGDTELEPAPEGRSEDELRLPLDADSGLRPGIFGVRVVHHVDVDPDPGAEVWRDGGSSSTLAVAVVPTVTPGAVVVDGADRLITVALAPAPSADEAMTLLLDGAAEEGHFRGVPEPGSIAGSDIQFRVRGLVSGTYRVRVIVAGATSLPSLVGGEIAGPEVVVP